MDSSRTEVFNNTQEHIEPTDQTDYSTLLTPKLPKGDEDMSPVSVRPGTVQFVDEPCNKKQSDSRHKWATREQRKDAHVAGFREQANQNDGSNHVTAEDAQRQKQECMRELRDMEQRYNERRSGPQFKLQAMDQFYGVDPYVCRLMDEHAEPPRKNMLHRAYMSAVKTMFTFLGLVMDPYVLLSTAAALLSVVFCVQLHLTADINFTLFTIPIIFPLTMSISASHTNKLKYAENVGVFKANLATLYYMQRELSRETGLGKDYVKHVVFLLRSSVGLLVRYLTTKRHEGKVAIKTALYSLFSKLAEANDMVRPTSCPPPLYTRLVTNHIVLVENMERILVLRDYKTPRTLRSYTKMFVFCTPFLMGPIFAVVVQKYGYLAGFYGAGLTTFIFATLQRIQDMLDDFFDGDSHDDVDLDELSLWFDSILTELTGSQWEMSEPKRRLTGVAAGLLEPAMSAVLLERTKREKRDAMV